MSLKEDGTSGLKGAIENLKAKCQILELELDQT